MAAVIYRKRAVSGRAWAVPGVLSFLAIAYSLITEHGTRDRLIGSLVVMLILVAILGGIWCLTLYSMNRYGTVTITADTLRVGRDRLPLNTIDPSGSACWPPRPHPPCASASSTSASTIQVPAHVQVDPAMAGSSAAPTAPAWAATRSPVGCLDAHASPHRATTVRPCWPRCSPLSATEHVVRQGLSLTPALNPASSQVNERRAGTRR